MAERNEMMQQNQKQNIEQNIIIPLWKNRRECALISF